MISILKEGNTRKYAKCNKCNCELSYLKEDIQYSYNRKNAYESELEYTYIKCPECKNIIKLS
jgi:hypothetical protein